MMEAGRLRERVKIESPNAVASGYGKGAAKPTWTEIGERWAEVLPVRAMEKIRAQQPGMETAYRVTLRYTDIVTPECRLRWNGRILYIHGITDIGARKEAVELVCNEREVPVGG